jgi:ketosteroid isomerase-like protein
MTDEQNAAVTALFRAISEYDADVVRTLFTDDATAVQPTRAVYHGPDGAVQLINDLSRTYVDFVVQPTRTVSQGDATVAEWNATVTDFGGGQSRVDGCSVLDFQGDKIHRLRSYWRPEDMHG